MSKIKIQNCCTKEQAIALDKAIKAARLEWPPIDFENYLSNYVMTVKGGRGILRHLQGDWLGTGRFQKGINRKPPTHAPADQWSIMTQYEKGSFENEWEVWDFASKSRDEYPLPIFLPCPNFAEINALNGCMYTGDFESLLHELLYALKKDAKNLKPVWAKLQEEWQ